MDGHTLVPNHSCSRIRRLYPTILQEHNDRHITKHVVSDFYASGVTINENDDLTEVVL